MIEKIILMLCLKNFTDKDSRIDCVEAMVNCVYRVKRPNKTMVDACWAQRDSWIKRIQNLHREAD